MAEDESLNCPDCQMQLLQQQNCEIPMEVNQEVNTGSMNVVVSKNNGTGSEMQVIRTPTSHWEPVMSTINRLEPHSRNTDEDLLYSSGGRPIVSMSTGNPNLNPMNGSGISYTPTSNYSSSTNVALGPCTPTYSSSTASCDMVSNANTCLTPISEGCSGYCATCAVLELPSNECYYRAPLSRHPVFPPIFYNQPPPLPGFSPIPECSPWGGCNSNDFPPFSFPQYPQPQQAAISDYFSSSGVVSAHVSGPSSLDHNNFGDSLSTTNVIPIYSSPNLRAEFPEQKNKEVNEEQSVNENKDADENFPSSSTSCDDSSTTDSESLISQKELIVEDDDDDESVSVSICNFDRNQKCTICQNSILTDCSSPHLDNILENIDEEITAEDLDITVSSADIEIGGIEDEVRCFHQKKISANSSPMQISLDRFVQLLGISSQNFSNGNKNTHNMDLSLMSINSHEYSAEGEQMVLLCSKCGKLALLVDSLEKQLNNTTHLLQESYYRNLTISGSSPIITNKSSTVLPSKEKLINFQIYQGSSGKQPNGEDICTFKEFHSPTQPNLLLEKQAVTVGTQTLLSGRIIQPNDITDNYSCSSSSLEFENVSTHFSKDATEINKAHESQTTSVIEILPFSDGEGILIPIEHSDSSSAQTISDLFNENLTVIENSAISIKNIVSDNLSKDLMQTQNSNVQNSITSPQSPKINKNNKESRNFDICTIPENKDDPCFFNNLEVTKENDTPCQKTYAKETEFMCDVCGKLLSTNRSLLQHLLRHEKQLEDGKQFKNSNKITNDKIVLNENSSSTSRNDKADDIPSKVSEKETDSYSKTVELLENSSNSTKNKEKYICCKCGLSFRTQNRLEKHLFKKCESKSIQCEFCERRFSKSSEMKVHLRVHAGQKPFCCDVCGLSFATKGNQVAHSRTHSSVKLFICHICTKGFNRKMALQFHLNRHSGTRPYSCSRCNLSFYDPSNLSNHTKKTHRNEIDIENDCTVAS